MRIEYLKAILKQDVGFFDTQAKTGDIVDSISTSTVVVQEAISEKLGGFIHYFSTFVGGFVVGLTTVWRMGLLTVATVPVLAFSGVFYAMILTDVTSKSHIAYAEAGFIAEQVTSVLIDSKLLGYRYRFKMHALTSFTL
ncbi:hypothetical protein O6H91_Y395100 [Diphasiastrum complanatum]|nr:hypothetical protein O6H91_Y395100 [Diphasiastrum complanatum]